MYNRQGSSWLILLWLLFQSLPLSLFIILFYEAASLSLSVLLPNWYHCCYHDITWILRGYYAGNWVVITWKLTRYYVFVSVLLTYDYQVFCVSYRLQRESWLKTLSHLSKSENKEVTQFLSHIFFVVNQAVHCHLTLVYMSINVIAFLCSVRYSQLPFPCGYK